MNAGVFPIGGQAVGSQLLSRENESLVLKYKYQQ